MNAPAIMTLCSTLDALSDNGDIDAISLAMNSVQTLLTELGPAEGWIERDGRDNTIEALARLKDTLDNMTSVYTRKLMLVERELKSMTKSSAAMGAYSSLSAPL